MKGSAALRRCEERGRRVVRMSVASGPSGLGDSPYRLPGFTAGLQSRSWTQSYAWVLNAIVYWHQPIYQPINLLLYIDLQSRIYRCFPSATG